MQRMLWSSMEMENDPWKILLTIIKYLICTDARYMPIQSILNRSNYQTNHINSLISKRCVENDMYTLCLRWNFSRTNTSQCKWCVLQTRIMQLSFMFVHFSCRRKKVSALTLHGLKSFDDFLHLRRMMLQLWASFIAYTRYFICNVHRFLPSKAQTIFPRSRSRHLFSLPI